MRRIVPLSLFLVLFAILASGGAPVWAVACGVPVIVNETLGANLTCSGDGPTVVAPAILDLGGFTITGTSKAGVGIRVTGGCPLGPGGQVTNGRVQNFNVGIQSSGTICHWTIGDSLSLHNNRVGLDLASNDSIVMRSAVTANLGNGAVVQGNVNTFERNTCSRNGGDGLTVVGNDNILDTNRCEGNDGDGIFVDGSRNTLMRNLGAGNGGTGVLGVGGGNSFDHNQGRNNSADGVRGIQSLIAPLKTDTRNYGTGNSGVNCLIDGFTPTGGGRYC